VEEWAKRHEKVEDVIYDGPVCRTCRYIDGAAVSWPCDAARILAYAAEQVAEKVRQALDTVICLDQVAHANRVREQVAQSHEPMPRGHCPCDQVHFERDDLAPLVVSAKVAEAVCKAAIADLRDALAHPAVPAGKSRRQIHLTPC
jgi:hypothetical protein